MKKILLSIVGLSLSIVSCKKEVDPFAIGIDHIGKLQKTTTVQELDAIYKNDSIVKRVVGDEFVGNANEIEIYDKQGKQLLILEATQEFDSLATIKSIRVIDSRYKTDKGLSPVSTFKELQDNYTIKKITNTLSTAVITIEELEAFFAINKKDLPSNLQFNTIDKIEAVQIPDTAKIKYFWLDWE